MCNFCELFSLIVSCFYEQEKAEYGLLVNITSYKRGPYSVVAALQRSLFMLDKQWITLVAVNAHPLQPNTTDNQQPQICNRFPSSFLFAPCWPRRCLFLPSLCATYWCMKQETEKQVLDYFFFILILCSNRLKRQQRKRQLHSLWY